MKDNDKYLDKVKQAYKKLKSHIYFQKALNIVKEDIVKFESDQKFEDYLKELAQILSEGNNANWQRYCERILEKIDVKLFPKKVTKEVEDYGKLNNIRVITNNLDVNQKVKINEVTTDIQFFIELPIVGHIISVLWIMEIGKEVDKELDENLYGNRLQEKELSKEYSPYMFKPYYNEYQKWRDKSLTVAERYYEEKKDAIILMIDIERYFYNIDIEESKFDEILKEKDNELKKRLHKFVYLVIEKYSRLMAEYRYTNNETINNMLPIGFVPSGILANWYLKPFDKSIIDRINPAYYGRYVDDIIIVDKVEIRSELYEALRKNNIKQVIDEYFIKSKPSIFKCNSQIAQENLGISTNEQEEPIDYIINEIGGTVPLKVNTNKLKVIYLKQEGTKSILDKYKEELRRNSSEFRLLPEDKELFLQSYTDIYRLRTEGSINTLKSVENVEVDKYTLAKYIGKITAIGNVIDDEKENKFYEDILKIYDRDIIMENYTTWEAILSCCTVNLNLKRFKQIYTKIVKTIDEVIVYRKNNEKIEEDIKAICKLQQTLKQYLVACANRSLALIWGDDVEELIRGLGYEENYEAYAQIRKAYCKTRMVNKSLLPLPIDLFVASNDFEKIEERVCRRNIRLNRLSTYYDETIKVENSVSSDDKDIVLDQMKSYKYHPYLVTINDVLRLMNFESIIKGGYLKEYDKEGYNSLTKKMMKTYMSTNYGNNDKFVYKHNKNKDRIESLMYKEFIKIGEDKSIQANIINIPGMEKDKLRIAIGTVQVKEENFKRVLKKEENKSLERYSELASVVNQAVQEKADILVLPENYTPYEWIPLLEREVKKTGMAIITGVEHIVYNQRAYNLTATLVPYKHDDFTYVYTNYRNKVFYSPEEKRQIRGYHYQPMEGSEYNLFILNNIWIPVYCCYEIASITDRSLFFSLADLVTIVEWNKDINYFSNIVESLSRDMHCYCVQVNTSEYGDSCIIKPSKTELKSVIRTKGGKNNTVLIGEVDIDKLRQFQIKEYELQKDDKQFKATPPQYNRQNVYKKLKGYLYEEIKEEKRKKWYDKLEQYKHFEQNTNNIRAMEIDKAQNLCDDMKDEKLGELRYIQNVLRRKINLNE